MNRPLSRLGTAVIVMIGLLLANIAYTQVIKADDYRADPNNKRTLVAEYSRQRGQITAAGGVVLARSDPVDDQYRYQRVYPDGAAVREPHRLLLHAVRPDRAGTHAERDPVRRGARTHRRAALRPDHRPGPARRQRRAEHRARRCSRPRTTP